MAISYNTGATGFSNGTFTAFVIPSGVLTNDVMIGLVECFTEDSTQPSIAFSGGGGTWTLIPMTDGSVNPQCPNDGSTFYAWTFAYYRVATSGDPGQTVTITETGSGSGTTWWGVAMGSYTGANQVSPFDAAGGAKIEGTTPLTLTLPTETASNAGDWAVYLAGGYPNGYGGAWVGPAGSTQRQNLTGTAQGSGIGAALFDSNGPTGTGSTGGGTVTTTGGSYGTTWTGGFTILLAPPASALVRMTEQASPVLYQQWRR